MTFAESEIIAGRYRVEAAIGEGGMGRVFRAFDMRLERLVAVKLLWKKGAEQAAAAESDGSSELLLREARAAAQLHHPNVVSVFDVGEHDGTAFLVMEHAEGRSLRSLVHRRDIPLQQKIGWLLDVARALEAAHAQGIIHRDVKPDNVLVTTPGVAKVLDFGVAKRRKRVPTSGQLPPSLGWKIVGTPEYMSPEQIRGDPIDGRADQFGWAVLAYELCTGRSPFAGPTVADVMRAVLSDMPPAPSASAPLPPDLDAIVMRALQKDAADRWPSMAEIVARLTSLAPGSLRVPLSGPMSVDPADAEKPTVDARDAWANVSTLTPDTLTPDNLPPPPDAPDPPSKGEPSVPTWAQKTARLPELPNDGTPKKVDQATGEAASKPRRPRDGRAGLLITFGLLAAVIALTTYGARFWGAADTTASGDPRAAAPGSGPAAGLALSGCNETSMVPLKEGVSLLRAGNWEQAHRRFEEATAADPECALAQLQLMMTGRSNYPATKVRAVFQKAQLLRGRLSPRDRDLLDAYEPLVGRDPPDRRAFGDRLIGLAAKYPDDAELATKVAFHATTAPLPRRLELAKRATEIDPGFSDGWQALGRTLSEANRPEEALLAYDKCLEVATGSTDCLADRIRERSALGRCAEVKDDARRWIARSPDTATGYLWHAEALAAEGKPRSSIEAVLGQRWSRLPAGDARPLLERAKIAALHGDFDGALARLAEHDQAVAGDANVEPHARSALLEIEILVELGREIAALDLARRFFERSVAWSSNIAADTQQFAVYYLLPRTNAIARSIGARREGEGVDWFDLASRDGTLDPTATWALSDAIFSQTPDDARASLARAPVPLDAARAAPSQFSKSARTAATFAEIGRALALADRHDDAIRFLRYAVGSCGALGETLWSTRALLLLGDELAIAKDTAGACQSYAALLDRWGASKSKSAARARERARALACKVN